MEQRFTSHDVSDLGVIAKKIVSGFQENRVFAFFGEMGAGKTTLIKKIVEVLGVEEEGSSPTFTMVNEYLSSTNGPVFHFDFYRIETEEEASAMGCEDYLYSGNYCLIEWPENILNLLPPAFVKVKIENQETIRIITIEKCL